MAVVTFLLAAALLSVSTASSCYPRCKFVFCGATYVYDLPHADKSFTGGICQRSGERIGVVNTGEARIYEGGRFIPISDYRPTGLAQPFTPSFFKGTYIPTVKYDASGKKLVPHKVDSHYSGVSRETYQTNQRQFINNKCVILPLRSWQIVRSNVVVGNTHRSRDNLRDCVSFETVLNQASPAPAAAASASPSASATPSSLGPLPVEAPEAPAPGSADVLPEIEPTPFN